MAAGTFVLARVTVFVRRSLGATAFIFGTASLL